MFEKYPNGGSCHVLWLVILSSSGGEVISLLHPPGALVHGKERPANLNQKHQITTILLSNSTWMEVLPLAQESPQVKAFMFAIGMLVLSLSCC